MNYKSESQAHGAGGGGGRVDTDEEDRLGFKKDGMALYTQSKSQLNCTVTEDLCAICNHHQDDHALDYNVDQVAHREMMHQYFASQHDDVNSHH